MTENFTEEAFVVRRTVTLLIAAPEQSRRQFSAVFSDSGYFILEADSEAEVLRLAQSARPDLILMANTPPRFDATAICLQLQTDRHARNVPVVVLIENDDESLINRALQSGASDYISYPIRANVLRQRVRFLLRMHTMQVDLQEKEQRYRIISTSISDYAYAFRVREDGTAVREWYTSAFEKITGYADSELGETGWERLIHPEDREIVVRRFQRLLRGQKDVSEFRIITKSGEVRWLSDTGQPIWDDERRRVTWIYGAAQDITERKRAEEVMRQQTVQLQARNEELDAFAHTVAHNLKNSIASMMMPASVALKYYDKMDGDQLRELLAGIVESGYKARAVIEAILLLAGVNRQSTVELGEVDMHEVILGAQNRLHSLIAETQAKIVMPEYLPTAVGYAPWVEEIWANYLSNALKYGGTPPVVSFGGEVQPAGGMVRFWVRDNGAGIAKADQAALFTPFTRLSQAKIEGHGLGLSVVQRIVQKLGGQVGVESAAGVGSTFWFTLPAALAGLR
ncbi:MAG: PAS domain-containing protein [Anaerolineae bacterium]|nr:PAS domain-containing protein [Anaerolineae bacterium]